MVVVAMGPVWAQQAGDPTQEQFSRQRAAIEQRLGQYSTHEQKARSALDLGKKALSLATEYNDQAAAEIARRAIGKALAAIEALRQARTRDLERLEAYRRTEATRATALNVVDLAQSKVDQADPGWVNEVQNSTRTAILLRRGEVAAKTRSFKMKEPPPPELPLRLSQSETGDIILVGPDESTLAGAAQGFVQGFGEKWLFGNENGKVTHALVYVGEQSGVRLFLDNQLGEGPRIISETEFKQRYGDRPLYTARPTLQPDGHEMFKAAYDFAKSNMEATERGHGLLGTKYGIFGQDNVVCSEAALFAVARAQAPGRRIVVESIGGKRLLNPVSVTPGDIYNQDGRGYFTVQPMEIDGAN